MSETTRDTTEKVLETEQGGKQCGRCKEIKGLEEFNKNRSRADGLSRYCKACRRELRARYRAAYISTFNAYKKKFVCAKCGETRTWVIDFHHNNPAEKLNSVSVLKDKGVPFEVIKNEITKCTPLCSNCHRELHFKNMNIEQFLKEKI